MSLLNHPSGEKLPREIIDLTSETREIINNAHGTREVIDLTQETHEIIDLTQEIDIDTYDGNDDAHTKQTNSERRAGKLPMRQERFEPPDVDGKLERHLLAIGEHKAAMIRSLVFITRTMVVRQEIVR